MPENSSGMPASVKWGPQPNGKENSLSTVGSLRLMLEENEQVGKPKSMQHLNAQISPII